MPSTPIVWVVPGLLGSHIDTRIPRGVQRSRRIWLDTVSVATCLLEMLRGTETGTLFPSELLDNLAGLSRHLDRTKPFGWRIFAYPWDWRQGVIEEGTKFAAEITAQVNDGAEEQYIVAHSLGGMLARAAWRALNEGGFGGVIKRIVTIGTPHRGSYAACQVWAERNPTLESLARLKRGLWNFPHPGFLPAAEWANEQVHTLFTSWTAPYETLPIPDAQGIEVDPLRPTVYQAATWAPSYGHPPQELLTLARDEWWPYMSAPASMPPPSVLRCVAGRGMATAQRLTAPTMEFYQQLPGNPFRGLGLLVRANRLSRLPGFEEDLEGDGSVPIGSAIVPGREALVVEGEHSALPTHPALLERIWELLLDAPIDPPPPPVEVNDPGMHPQFVPQQLPHPAVFFRPCCHHREAAPC